ncbi:hypothetical protein BLD48_05075 [Exiguobacterium sp. KRL4]|uniref:hypothetical protein n=1 Tax=Exiguobacterium sp. KRL4 TaxID=1914536 RepID=UPI0008F83096|nr:hypothetical protein [Exiguobacterium sp. KRL4]OIN67589.1 hypothetical protein BLD48_05075 [Exiguobacterium sp. KRL4]
MDQHEQQKEQERLSRKERRKQKRNRRSVALGGVLATVLIVGGWGYMVSTNDASQATSTVESPKSVDSEKEKEKKIEKSASTDQKKKEPKAKKKTDKPEIRQAAWVTRPFVDVYQDANRSSVIYKADLGDVYEILDAENGMVHLKLSDAVEGYIPETDVRMDVPSAVKDKTLLATLQQVVTNQPIEKPEQYLGQPLEKFEAKYGALSNTQKDAVNTYHFSNAGYLLVVSDGIVEAIDWTNASASGLSALGKPIVETSYGTWYQGEKLQLKAFPDNGSTRLRLARDPGK